MDAPFRPPLRGREQELAVIRRKLSQVRAGTGCVVVVEGSAGLGKTRLLDECVSMAVELSFRVGRGAAEPGRVIKLGALFDALFEGDPPLADRRALNDVHASPKFLFWLLQDVQSLIEEAALKNPVLICLDDLHWGGTSFSLAMRQLPFRLSSLPVAWVMAFRPERGLHQVQQAKIELIESGAELIRLGPLNREAVAQVATDVLGVEADEDLLQKAERVQGNPFLLVEFFRGLQDDLIVSLDSERARLVEDRLPRRVSDSMRGRLARMSSASERAANPRWGYRRVQGELPAWVPAGGGGLPRACRSPSPAKTFRCQPRRARRQHRHPHSHGRQGRPERLARGLVHRAARHLHYQGSGVSAAGCGRRQDAGRRLAGR